MSEDVLGGEDLDGGGDNSTSVAAGQLLSIIERIERVEVDQKELADDKKEIYAEAKGNGFDTKILRKVVAQRKRDREEVEEENAMLDLYLSALQNAK